MDITIVITTRRDADRFLDLSLADERPGCPEPSRVRLHECNDEDAAGGTGDHQRE